MNSTKKLSRADKIRLLQEAEQGLISPDELLAKLGAIGPTEYWLSKDDPDTGLPGPWRCDDKEIPYDDPNIRKRRNVELLHVSYGNRHGNKTIEYTDEGPNNNPAHVTVHSTGIPFAHRETDVDLSEYTPPTVSDNPAPDKTPSKPRPVKPTEPAETKEPAKPYYEAKGNDGYWDDFQGGLGEGTMDYMMNQ